MSVPQVLIGVGISGSFVALGSAPGDLHTLPAARLLGASIVAQKAGLSRVVVVDHDADGCHISFSIDGQPRLRAAADGPPNFTADLAVQRFDNRVAAAQLVNELRSLSPGEDLASFSLLGVGGAIADLCALADQAGMRTIVLPPAGLDLGVLGLASTPRVVEASKSVIHLGDGLDDHRLYAEFGHLNSLADDDLPQPDLASIEAYAGLRLTGDKEEITLRAHGADRAALEAAFRQAQAERTGKPIGHDPVEWVTLRLRRIGKAMPWEWAIAADQATPAVPSPWDAAIDEVGIVMLKRGSVE